MPPGARLRRFIFGVLLLASAGAVAAQRDFDVPAGPAAQGITRFAQQAGLPVLFPLELVEDRRTAMIRGQLEVQDALQRLLDGSGLAASINSRGQISIRLLPDEPRAGASRANYPAAPNPYAPAQELPEVEVTGTRIVRDGMTTPTPVARFSRAELDELAPTTLTDALSQLPHFLNSDTPHTQSFGTSGAVGASYMNLRGIGTIRTLMLLDGRRVVPSTRFGTVDLALFPQSLVERVEVVTGGASASYGSDAVSGVVNTILDDDFRGLRGHLHSGISGRGDHESHEASLTWGTRIGDASSLLLAGEVFRSDGIRGYDSRDWYDGQAAISNPDPDGPAEIIARDVRSTNYTYGGLITSGPLAGTRFLAGGAPAPFERGSLYTPVTQSGGSGVNPAGEHVWLLPDQERISGFARLTTQPAAAVSAYLQVLAGRTRNEFGKEPPALWGAWEATIYADNAFLPEQIATSMQQLGLESFRMGRAAARGELGNTRASLSTNMVSATLGADWHTPEWSIGGYYQYGRNDTIIGYEDVVRIDRIYRAIDSVRHPDTGEIICRSTLTFSDDGCVPLNLFGEGSVDAIAREWVLEGDTAQLQDVREQVAEATIKGDVPWRATEAISVAAGLSWRQEAVDSHVTRHPAGLDGLIVEPAESQGYRGLPAAYVNAPNIFERTSRVDVAGRYSVWEAFGEAMFPLLRGRRLAERFDLHAATRIARYSGSGTIPAWRLGVDWQLLPPLRLRATRSRDVRAGSLSDRYDVSRLGITIVDRVQPDEPVYAVVAERRGNPEVDPERSDTTTVGLILRPTGLRGLSLSADYFDIRVKDAISLYGVQNIIDGCATGQQDLCELIERGPGGLITLVNNLVLNIAGARMRGIELELSWRRDVDWLGGDESVALRLFGIRSLESSTTDSQGVRTDRVGQTGLFGGAPRFQSQLWLAYERGPWRLALQQRYVSSGSYDSTYGPGDIDKRRVRAAATSALNVTWRPSRWPGSRVFLNVQNLFDADPPIAPDWGFGGSIPTNEGLFDVLGRRFVAGVRFEL